MNPHLESVQYPERSIVLLVDAFNFEYIFGADALTIAFAFACGNNRPEGAGREWQLPYRQID
jgi:hypothetical protein